MPETPYSDGTTHIVMSLLEWLQQLAALVPHPRKLGPIDLTLDAGELLFLVGGNGSGKSTLAKLITGFYVPESGEIRVDGALVTAAERGAYREHFSMVSADFYLFERLLGLSGTDLEHRAGSYLK